MSKDNASSFPASGYAEEFGLAKGTSPFGYKITHVELSSEPTGFHLFPLRLGFSGPVQDPSALLDAIMETRVKGKEQHVVYSRMGVPFELHFGRPEVENEAEHRANAKAPVSIWSVGTGFLRFDLPTKHSGMKEKGEKEKEKRKEEGKEEEVTRSWPEVKQELEFRTARFEGGTCHLCGETIKEKEKIAKPKDTEKIKPSTWSHAKCMGDKLMHEPMDTEE